MERWRQPAIPLAVEEDPNSATLWSDGRIQRGANITYGPADIQRLKEGRICLGPAGGGECGEPFETPFPDRCPLCGYEVARRQRRDFAISYEGEKHVGPSTTLRYELDRLDEWGARHFYKTKTGIIVPRGVS